MAKWHFKANVRKVDVSRIFREACQVKDHPVVVIDLQNSEDSMIIVDDKVFQTVPRFECDGYETVHNLGTVRFIIEDGDYATLAEIGGNGYNLIYVVKEKAQGLARRFSRAFEQTQRIKVEVTVV